MGQSDVKKERKNLGRSNNQSIDFDVGVFRSELQRFQAFY